MSSQAIPSPVKPDLQAQPKPPALLMQVALSSQLSCSYRHSSRSTQNSPSPAQPSAHSQPKPPKVLVHTALASQTSLAHSSTSAHSVPSPSKPSLHAHVRACPGGSKQVALASQPPLAVAHSSASSAQSAPVKPASQVTSHAPATHAAVPLTAAHAAPHAPQWSALVAVSVSQPLAQSSSQLSVPAAHPGTSPTSQMRAAKDCVVSLAGTSVTCTASTGSAPGPAPAASVTNKSRLAPATRDKDSSPVPPMTSSDTSGVFSGHASRYSSASDTMSSRPVSLVSRAVTVDVPPTLAGANSTMSESAQTSPSRGQKVTVRQSTPSVPSATGSDSEQPTTRTSTHAIVQARVIGPPPELWSAQWSTAGPPARDFCAPAPRLCGVAPAGPPAPRPPRQSWPDAGRRVPG